MHSLRQASPAAADTSLLPAVLSTRLQSVEWVLKHFRQESEPDIYTAGLLSVFAMPCLQPVDEQTHM